MVAKAVERPFVKSKEKKKECDAHYIYFGLLV